MTVKIESLSVRFGSIKALENVSCAAAPGRITAVIGPNAAGKSTLLRACIGAIRPASGRVLVDDRGSFVGALAPGTAALLSIPAGPQRLHAFSSVEVTAAPGSWSWVDDVTVGPPASGIVLRTARVDARQCGRTGQYTQARAATRAELDEFLGEGELRWETPTRREGQAWLEAHHGRVQEILARHRVELDPRQ